VSKKLYIHIGSHKTGTTSIQRALFQNSALLNKHNLSYFCKNPDGSKNVQHNLNKWIHLFPESFEDGARVYNCKKLSKDISTLPHDVIISAEHFSFIFDKEELKQLKNSLKQNFSEIEIIVYLRRQDKNVVSLYNENRKNATLKKRFFYGDKSTALPEHRDYFRLYLDYNEKLLCGQMYLVKKILLYVFSIKILL
jgi:hypothetical protein